MSWLNPPESAYLQQQSARVDRRLAFVGALMALLNVVLAGWNDVWLVVLMVVLPTVGIGAAVISRSSLRFTTRRTARWRPQWKACASVWIVSSARWLMWLRRCLKVTWSAACPWMASRAACLKYRRA